MADSVCFICGNPIENESDRGVIKERALKTFIDASKRRKDDHHKWLQHQRSVVVHEKCRKGVYTKEKNIAEAERVANEQKLVTRGGKATFDFKKLCIYCTKDATELFEAQQLKLPVERRDVVQKVMTLKSLNSIKTAAINRKDKWSEDVLRRIGTQSDLVAAEGRYHRSCRIEFILHTPGTSGNTPKGRPESAAVTECIDFIMKWMEDEEDLCQFTLEDILESYDGIVPRKDYLLTKLKSKDEIFVTPGTNQFQKSILCYKNIGHTILTDSWYQSESRKKNIADERMRVVQEAAKIIREDIRSKVYSVDKYPSPDAFLDSVNDDIPESLKLLLETVAISPRKRTDHEFDERNDKTKKKLQAIAHSLITATRPRSFTSPILLGVATLLYRKYGSRHLVDALSGLGFSSSYGEVRKFEVSSLQQPLEIITHNSFTQFIFDNTDINMDTIDGRDTFHAMGGIQTFTPKKSLIPRTPIEKAKTVPKAVSLREYGSIPLEHFDKPSEGGLAKITVKAMAYGVDGEVLPTSADLLWMYGKWRALTELPGWNGFMEKITSDQPFQTSRILCLPFIRAPPSDVDTIYTALKTAAKKCIEQGQKVCFVTFDQPLYIKARNIVASSIHDAELSSVIVRLGGFHLIMSYMGAIGYIMDGSGLNDLFNVCFALASTKTMLSGHYYSRAVRGHILAQLALGKIILSRMELSIEEHEALSSLLNKYGTGQIDMNNPSLEMLLGKFQRYLQELEGRSPTAKLWVQYFRMVSLLKQFIEAERSGDWELHIKSVTNMIPYFHASGHSNYAKASQIYLQDMQELHQKLPSSEYQQFVTKGFFTIRRTPKHWSGIWSDMTIEQVLMRAVSSCGGLSQGRGITDGTLARWIAGMPTAVDVTHQVEEFCGVSFTSSDQHVDTTTSRKSRDNIDVEKFSAWLESHDPFPHGSSIMCISTGVLGDDNINCHLAFQKGKESMEKIIGNNFKEVIFRRKNRVVPLQAVKSKVKLNDEAVPISPETIFRRIPFQLKSAEQLMTYFSYELAPYPLSLFDDDGFMRKTKKSDLYKLFDSVNIETNHAYYVVDGGFLLHRVVWNTGELFSAILIKYQNYVMKHFGKNCTIVFDGYPEERPDKNRSTKSAERARRARAMSSPSVLFDVTMSVTMPKERFLLNELNKKRLILMLTEKLCSDGIQVKQAVEDADTLIVSTAIEKASEGGNVFVVGEDSDLLVLLTHHISNEEEELATNLFLMKPGRSNQDTCIYTPSSSKLSEEAKQNILFLHAFSGCDCTSSFFRQGKTKFIKTFDKNETLQQAASIFNNQNSTLDMVAEAGVKFVTELYMSGSHHSWKPLNELRLELFQRALVKSHFNLASLPPTEDAIRLHSSRVYLQVQAWKNNQMNPTDWGWKITPNGLLPIRAIQPPAPQELLNNIFCSCTKGCQALCSCRRVGIRCSAVCMNCKGHACLNSLSEEDIFDSTEAEAEMSIIDEEVDLDLLPDEQFEDIPGPSSPKRRKVPKQ